MPPFFSNKEDNECTIMDDKQVEKAISQIPDEVKEIFQTILSQDFSLRLVGGSVRDYLLDHSWGNDWDVELFCQYRDKDSQELAAEEKNFYWGNVMAKLAFSLRQKRETYKVELLPFHIVKMSSGHHELEFSLPRKEIYAGQVEKSYGHSDFQAFWDGELPLEESFKRRDFSMNAMALEISKKNSKLIGHFKDPFGGLKDLEKATLRPCDETSFYYDPVRFLRAIRFSLKYSLSLNAIDLKKFNIHKLSKHYFLSEAKKSKHPHFFKHFFSLCSQHELQIPDYIMPLSPLVYLNIPFAEEKEAVVDLLSGSMLTGLSYLRIEKVASSLAIKRKWSKAIISFHKYYDYWFSFKFDQWKASQRDRPQSEVVSDIFFERFFTLYHASQVVERKFLEKLISAEKLSKLFEIIERLPNYSKAAQEHCLREGVDKKWIEKYCLYFALFTADSA